MKTFIAEKKENILSFLYAKDKNIDWHNEIDNCKLRAFYYLIGRNYQTKPGDKIIYDPGGEYPEPAVNTDVKVLYEDEYLVAFDKPSPLPTHPSGAYVKNTLTHLVRDMGYKNHLVNRLDAETSGIVIMGKNKNTTYEVAKAFLQGEKWYLSLVYGRYPKRATFQCLLGPKPSSKIKKKKGINSLGKPSLTHFFGLHHNEGYSLVLANPKTGRTHQIRAHLLEMGYPVVGDKIYGKSEEFFIRFLQEGLNADLLKKLELDRQFLHCYKVQFKHPIWGKRIIIKSKLPRALISFLKSKGCAIF